MACAVIMFVSAWQNASSGRYTSQPKDIPATPDTHPECEHGTGALVHDWRGVAASQGSTTDGGGSLARIHHQWCGSLTGIRHQWWWLPPRDPPPMVMAPSQGSTPPPYVQQPRQCTPALTTFLCSSNSPYFSNNYFKRSAHSAGPS